MTAVSEGFDEAVDSPHSDEPPQAAVETEPGQRAGDGHEPTGNATVDAVLDSLERLDGAPVSDHVAVFEAAHERLRGALADAGSDQQTS